MALRTTQTALIFEGQATNGHLRVSQTALIFEIPLIPTPCVPVGGNGVYISDLKLFIGPSTSLYKNPVPSSQIIPYESTVEGRNAIVLDFNNGDGLYARDLGAIFSWPTATRTAIHVWQPSIIMQPEGIYGRATDWDDGGTPGAKFIQGVMVEADSFGIPKTFFLQDSDTGSLHAINELATVFSRHTEKAFSCPPFVAHSARLISSDGVQWRVWNSRLVFQPFPEATVNWQTERTSLGLTGFGHIREMNIPHISFNDLTLVLTFDYWPTITLQIPNSGGQQVKTKVTLPANKFKLCDFQVFTASFQPFRVFASDLEVKVKQWGSTESYMILKPFGGPSSAGAKV